MKKLIYSRINYKITDCNISMFGEVGKKSKTVAISYKDEEVCVITDVKDYTEIISYIKCMFMGGKMYCKISSKLLKELFVGTYKSTFHIDVKKVDEEVDSNEKSVKIESLMYKRTISVVKKAKCYVQDIITSCLMYENLKPKEYKDPVQNLRFNLY